MKRDIVTTIEFSNGYVAINVLEKLSTNTVEIFASKGKIANAHSFLTASLKEVEQRLGARITESVVVIDPMVNIDAKIELVKESIRIAGDVVSRKDVDNLLQLTQTKHKQTNREIILVQPLQFEVQDSVRKKYLKAPIYKAGELLFATMAVTSIASEAYDYVNQVVKAQGLEITQILLKPQTISQTNLSESALVSGAVLIHFGYHHAFVTINRNNGTVAAVTYYEAGFKHLLKAIATRFSCSVNEARELVTIYGNLANRKENRVIYTRQEGVKELTHTAAELSAIIEQYSSRILTVANKFIEQKGVQSLPVILSGEFSHTNGFEEYAKMVLQKSISTYHPMSYLEMNYSNHSTLGVMNLNQRLDGVLSKQLNTIVETNPNTFSTLNKKPKNFMMKFMEKIGGKYDYN